MEHWLETIWQQKAAPPSTSSHGGAQTASWWEDSRAVWPGQDTGPRTLCCSQIGPACFHWGKGMLSMSVLASDWISSYLQIISQISASPLETIISAVPLKLDKCFAPVALILTFRNVLALCNNPTVVSRAVPSRIRLNTKWLGLFFVGKSQCLWLYQWQTSAISCFSAHTSTLCKSCCWWLEIGRDGHHHFVAWLCVLF